MNMLLSIFSESEQPALYRNRFSIVDARRTAKKYAKPNDLYVIQNNQALILEHGFVRDITPEQQTLFAEFLKHNPGTCLECGAHPLTELCGPSCGTKHQKDCPNATET